MPDETFGEAVERLDAAFELAWSQLNPLQRLLMWRSRRRYKASRALVETQRARRHKALEAWFRDER